MVRQFEMPVRPSNVPAGPAAAQGVEAVEAPSQQGPMPLPGSFQLAVDAAGNYFWVPVDTQSCAAGLGTSGAPGYAGAFPYPVGWLAHQTPPSVPVPAEPAAYDVPEPAGAYEALPPSSSRRSSLAPAADVAAAAAKMEEVECDSGGFGATRPSRRRRPGRRRGVCVEPLQRTTPASLPLAVPDHVAAEVESTHNAVDVVDETEFGEARCNQLSAALKPTDDQERAAAFDALRGAVLHLSLAGPLQCRLVQKALEVASTKEALVLINELRGHVRRAIESPHANYVIQKIIEVVPPASTSFITEELRGVGALIANHRYGCRIISRLLEHSGCEHTEALIEEVLHAVLDLASAIYGHHAVNSILEHGTVEQKMRTAAALSGNAGRLSLNRHGSSVLEKLLEHGAQGDRQRLIAELLHAPGHVLLMAESQFGCHVVKALLNCPDDLEWQQELRSHLLVNAARLMESKSGKRLLRDFDIVVPTAANPEAEAEAETRHR